MRRAPVAVRNLPSELLASSRKEDGSRSMRAPVFHLPKHGVLPRPKPTHPHRAAQPRAMGRGLVIATIPLARRPHNDVAKRFFCRFFRETLSLAIPWRRQEGASANHVRFRAHFGLDSNIALTSANDPKRTSPTEEKGPSLRKC